MKFVPGSIWWIDYPILALGDVSGRHAPWRQVEVISYDGDKYVSILVEGVVDQIKSGYLHKTLEDLMAVQDV